MSYSVAIRCSRKKKEQMWKFLKDNYKEPSALFGETQASTLTDDLSYDDSEQAFGFDYQSWIGMTERHYVFCVVKWMALKIGRKKKFKRISTVESIPYIVHDGNEFIPVLANSEWKTRVRDSYKWALVDDNGYRTIRLSPRTIKDIKSIDKELTELNTKYCEGKEK